MTSFWKTFVVVCALSVTLFLILKQDNGLEMLVEASVVEKKSERAQRDLVDLFNSLGMTPPLHGFASPCYDLEKTTTKYCTKRDVIKILEKGSLSRQDAKFFMEVVNSKNACELVGEYIGRVCQMRNFNKIIDYFILKN